MNKKLTIWFYEFIWTDTYIESKHYGNYIGTKKDFEKMTDEANKKTGFFMWKMRKQHASKQQIIDYWKIKKYKQEDI